MNRGLVWFVGGCMVTIFSYFVALSSPYDGHYVIAYGAIIWGASQYFRGRAYATGRVSRNAAAQDLLNIAATYEDIDRAKALALYEEIARIYPGTRAGAEAERNIQTLKSAIQSQTETLPSIKV